MFVEWFSVLCVLSIASASPVSVYPVRPYVFLAPELPKFALQPLKVQPAVQPIAQPAVQPVSNIPKTDSLATRQYVLVYPSYQYITTRQDEGSSAGIFESIQNYIINFGNTQTQSDESSQIMDAVEPDKLQPITETKSGLLPAPEKLSPAPNEIKQKFFYSYATPASTVPLTNDRRFYLLSEQPQVLGTFSGSSLNPVFNLPAVPLVVSRSNVAQSDDQQPGKVVSENVQKFSQIPPVMNTIVEQTPQVQIKSIQSDSVVAASEQAQNRVADPVPTAASELPQNRVVDPVPTAAPVQENRVNPLPTDVPLEAKSAIVADASVVVNSIISGSDIVASPVVSVSTPATVEARSNAIPLTVTSESVSPIVESPVVSSSVVQAVVEGNESIVQQSVVGQSLKSDVQSVVPDIAAVPSISVVPAVPAVPVVAAEQTEAVASDYEP